MGAAHGLHSSNQYSLLYTISVWFNHCHTSASNITLRILKSLA